MLSPYTAGSVCPSHLQIKTLLASSLWPSSFLSHPPFAVSVSVVISLSVFLSTITRSKMAKTGSLPFVLSNSELSKQWEQKNETLSLSCPGAMVDSFWICFVFNFPSWATLSPLSNPRKSGCLVLFLCPLESRQMILFKSEQITSKNFKGAHDYIYNCGKVYKSKNTVDSRVCLQCRRLQVDPWVRKIPWRREWQPTPVFLPGEFHGQRRLVGCSPWGHMELDMTEWLTHLYRL